MPLCNRRLPENPTKSGGLPPFFPAMIGSQDKPLSRKEKNMTLGERIAYYRKKAGYSQEGLAERLGSAGRPSANGRPAKPPRRRTHHCAGGGTGISTDTLLLGKEEPERPYTEAETVRQPAPTPEWLDHLPRHIGRLFRRKAILPGILWRRRGWGSCWWGCWRASALAVFFPCRTARGA